MALNEADRQELLAELGLAPDGEQLTIAPQPKAPAPEPEPAPEAEAEAEAAPASHPDVEALTDEQLLTPGVFDTYKLAASVVGRPVSSPYNKRLYARIQEAINRQRVAEQEAKQEAKQQRKKEDRTNVRDKVRAATANKAAQAVLEAMTAAGINLDDLATLLKERNGDD